MSGVEQRIAGLQRMIARNPADARPRFGLALEYERAGRWEDAVRELRAYLDMADDEGNAWGRLAGALGRLGRQEEARAALLQGSAAARRHGHPSMAAEFEALLGEQDQG